MLTGHSYLVSWGERKNGLQKEFRGTPTWKGNNRGYPGRGKCLFVLPEGILISTMHVLKKRVEGEKNGVYGVGTGVIRVK